jgi:RHS repeat-associated protein
VEKGSEEIYYVYDAAGQRVRKVVEKNNNGALIEERIYLGGFEVFRRSNGNGLKLERETLHIMDDQQRIALVETRTQGNDPAPEQLIRYQYGNHLGSASLELDHQAQIISYEEYYPYGSTSYQAVRSQTETPKRYRYTGKERDEESGLYYHGARYYAPWLSRWISSDPAGLIDGVNFYQYARQNPIRNVDHSGTQTETQSEKVLALGLYERQIEIGGKQVRVKPGIGKKLVRAAAQENIPGAHVIDITEMPSWKSVTKLLGGKNAPSGSFAGIRSAVVVQEALEGGTVSAIHFDVRGINLARRGSETSSELASVIGAMASGKSKVDIYIQSEKGLSLVRKGSAVVEGMPLPKHLAQRLPRSFRGTPSGAASIARKAASGGGNVLKIALLSLDIRSRIQEYESTLPEQKEGKKAELVGGFVGSTTFGALGSAAGVGAVYFLASNPPGWLVIGGAILGGVIFGSTGEEIGRSTGRDMHRAFKESEKAIGNELYQYTKMGALERELQFEEEGYERRSTLVDWLINPVP